ncbi:MAG: 50S ribosomal protein L24 [Pseudomonadota bacterium]
MANVGNARPKLKVKKGDKVVVLAGRDKGKQGEILKVFPSDNRVIVQGVNVTTRHVKPSAQSQGGLEQKESTIHVSNVAHIDPKTDRPTKVGYRTLEDGRKVRFARASGEVLDV